MMHNKLDNIKNLEHLKNRHELNFERVLWYIDNSNPKLCLQKADLENISVIALTTLVSDKTISLVNNPKFPLSVNEILKINEQGYKALLDSRIIKALLFNSKKPSIELVNNILSTLAGKISSHKIDSDGGNATPQPIENIERIIDRVIEAEEAIQQQEVDPPNKRLNGFESIHNSNTHDSVTISLKKLYENYSSELEASRLLVNLESLYNWVYSLPSDGARNDIAKNAITRLTTDYYYSTSRYADSDLIKEINKELSIVEVLVLVWVAANDKSKRNYDLQNMLSKIEGIKERDSSDKQILSNIYERLIEQLVEVEFRDLEQKQQEYFPGGIDSSKEPDPTCLLGIPEKLIIALNSIHNDVSISYISDLTEASFYLQNLVDRYTKAYVNKILNKINIRDFDNSTLVSYAPRFMRGVKADTTDTGCSGVRRSEEVNSQQHQGYPEPEANLNNAYSIYQKLEQEGVNEIYNKGKTSEKVEDKILQKIKERYPNLYSGKTKEEIYEKYKEFVDSGKYKDISNILEHFKQNLDVLNKQLDCRQTQEAKTSDIAVLQGSCVHKPSYLSYKPLYYTPIAPSPDDADFGLDYTFWQGGKL